MPELAYPLGQDLFRQALEASSLEPFHQAAEQMKDDTAGELVRANTLKAIRFGLDGLAIHGWQETITKELDEELPFGDTSLEFRFTRNNPEDRRDPFPSHDYGLETFYDHGNYIKQYTVLQTQGAFALNTLQKGLTGSFHSYLSYSQAKIEGIPLKEMLGAISTFVGLGRELGLDRVPDFCMPGDKETRELFNDIYRGSETLCRKDIIEALSGVATNPVRFSRVPVTRIMERYIIPGEYKFDCLLAPETDSDELIQARRLEAASLIARAVHATTRASQRMDGVVTVIDGADPDTVHTVIDIEPNKRGKLEATWGTKDRAPAPRIKALGEPIPGAPLVLVTARNKCPIGYTPDAFHPMPNKRICDAILYYLRENNLDHPANFTMPKVVNGC